MNSLSAFAPLRERKGLVLFCLFITIIAHAQSPYLSNKGWFQVDQKKGCNSFTITIQRTDLVTAGCGTGPSQVNCVMNFMQGANGVDQQNQFTFTYTTAGTYTLRITYPNIGTDEITVTVVQNTLPTYELYTCSGNKVSLKVTDTKYDQGYVVDMNGDGTPENSNAQSGQSIQYSYPASGNYNVSVRGFNNNAADNCQTNTQAFTAVSSLSPPSVTALTAVDASTLKMDFPVQPHIALRSEIAVNNGTTFQQYQSLYEATTTNATSLRVDDNYYCFRLNNYDPCANANHYSPIICSQNFDLSVVSGENDLSWTTATTGINSVSIQRNGSNYTTIPGAPLSYVDKDVICKTNYCYNIISNYSGATSTSLQKCGEAFTTIEPLAINNVSTVVGITQGVDLNWLVDPTITAPEFKVYRSAAGSAYQLIGTTTDTKLQDPDYKTEAENCYRINYTDACGNASPSGDPVCPIRLTGSLGDKNIADLLWDQYNGWLNGVNRYVIEKYTTSGQLLSTADVGTGNTYKDDPADAVNQVVRYVVKAYANDTGVTLSSSNYIDIAKKTNLFSPTAFTPNGDNLNDNFVVIGYYITKLKLKIFDRWGVMLYSTDNNEPWNGTRSGTSQPMPTGTYVWKAEITDFTGQTFSEEGTVFLIRKNN